MNGTRLKELRNEKGLKQYELARILNISTSAIGMYERNSREPDDETKIKIANFFDVSVAYLMGETDQRKSPPHYDDTFVAFYEGYKDLDDEDIKTVQAVIKSLKERKENKKK